MSVDAAVARVAQLEAMLGLSPAGAPVSTPQHDRHERRRDRRAASPRSSRPSPARRRRARPRPPRRPPPDGDRRRHAGRVRRPYAAEIDAAAAKYNVDPALLRGLIRQESNFNANAGSPAGARGLTPAHARHRRRARRRPVRPAQAIEGGAKYLRQQLDQFGGDPAKALAAYNAGPGAVQRYGGVPPYAETQNYVRKVLAYAAEYRQAAPRPPPPPPP